MNDFLTNASMAIGFLVQWLRSKPYVPEWVPPIAYVVVGVGAYWLGTDGADLASKAFWQEAWKYILIVAGVTQFTSHAANLGGVKSLKTNVDS